MFNTNSGQRTNLVTHVLSFLSSFWKQSERARGSGTLNSITSIKSWLNQLGPVNYMLLFISWDGKRILVPRSAGLLVPGIWHHITVGIVEWNLATLFATDDYHRKASLA